VLAGQLGGQDSPLGGGQGSEPNSTKMGRKLRFIIPQVKLNLFLIIAFLHYKSKSIPYGIFSQ
jgi:hypothetical protein